ncbi:F0F1 ATP synthase subunit gamma [Silanimonas sp.]|uniref:F0F1 ATP synthase subunit gamma n=1 Tax=Silanimonas sp. TaxID=1929290 RepID=UPI001BC00861|nr:F0F1 ATP synthase subunit gamma [Silanimonas sp.]MBS3895239.1 F0F1 ATP synthase subunit gamma [Silanimonas sp.]
MAGGREIKTKIKSVQNTRKVTRALEMVSASKIRKAQEKMKASRPYARLMKQVVGHIAHANTDHVHPFMAAREEVKRVGYIIISTDRGLCGGLNSQMFRRILADMREWQSKGVEIDVVCIGQKAVTFFRRLKVDMLASVTHLGEKPEVAKLIGVTKTMFDGYTEGRLDRVLLCYNDFVNTMSQRPTLLPLLPLQADASFEAKHDWDYLYEPDPQTVLDFVLTRYVESLVYQAVLENLASEHAARMVAMKAASDNATKLIGSLNLVYNKARQAAITQEISEIVGGAAAV